MSKVVVFEPQFTVADIEAHTLEFQRLAVLCDNYDEYSGTLTAGHDLSRTSTQLLVIQSVLPINCTINGVVLTGRFFYFESPTTAVLSVGMAGSTPITVICS